MVDTTVPTKNIHGRIGLALSNTLELSSQVLLRCLRLFGNQFLRSPEEVQLLSVCSMHTMTKYSQELVQNNNYSDFFENI